MKPLSHHNHHMNDDNLDYEMDSNADTNTKPTSTDYDSGNENQKEDDDDNIIPWKKLLRKTNSRLNLIS